jgi:thymidylate synthase
MIKENNFNDLFINSIFKIYTEGQWTNPRKFNCKELIGEKLMLTNPRNCLITIKERKLNYAYLIIEKFMYLSQFSKPDILIAYNKKMKDFLNEKINDFDGAYGPRIKKNNQLEYCYNELKKDNESRRAVITIHDSTDCIETKDSACTLNWQFLIRNNKLNLLANMRSNDLLWGLCLDIPAFCFIQEVMAYWLKVDIGNYIHYNGSFHYYKEFEEKLLNYLKLNEQPDDIKLNNLNELNNETNPEWNIDFENTEEALNLFWKNEELIRNNKEYNKTKYDVINKYLERLEKYWKNKIK